MAGEAEKSPGARIVTSETVPIYVTFFAWGLGTGSLQLARPLFAFEVTGNIFLVSFLVASSSVARIISGPITGYLTDRWGRKPLVIAGAAIRGLTTLGQFYTDTYVPFFVLEFIGQMGVSMWTTSTGVLVGDVTTPENRGRVMAVRTMSSRIGFVAGPAIAGALAVTLGLKYVFLFSTLTKIINLVVMFWISESRPEEARQRTRDKTASADKGSLWVSVFLTKTFIALAVVTFGLSMMQMGVFQTLVPVFSQEEIGLSELDIGNLVSFASIIALVVAFPNGAISDRYGRKVSLVPGMLFLAASAVLLGFSVDYMWIVAMMVMYGIAEGMVQGSTQVYAVDLAPVESRGTVVGVWSIFMSLGGVVTTLLVGWLYTEFGPMLAFNGVGGFLFVSAMMLALMARETAGRRALSSSSQ
ncbi:MAG: MFS transporter [Chloroflexota bacterium]|nr:MFS transporter [Chloroflexota bacterium]